MVTFEIFDECAIVGDAHGGTKDGNLILMEHQLTYLDHIIDECVRMDIKVMIQTGDLFDVRKSTNTNVLREWKMRFFNKLRDNGIHLITLVGNHDMYLRNSIHPNSITEHVSHYDNITIIDEPTEILLGGNKVLIVPWVCSGNSDDIFNAIETTDAQVCIGHFEIKGARMESGICTDGLPLSTFSKFKLVLSGHFHSKGRYENVEYVGTPYQMCWGDFGHDKGFYVLDTETLDLEFIKNENDLFIKITYDEDQSMDIHLDADLTGKYVKVVIEHRDNFPKYEKWFSRLETKGMVELKVIEPLMDRSSKDTEVEVDTETLSVQSTEDLIVEYVNDLYPEKKDKLSRMMLSLHTESRK